MFKKLLKICTVFMVLMYSTSAMALELKVALYPYAPRVDQFKKVISEKWNKIEPDVKITWVEDWDGGYFNEPKDEYDIFVFDATYFSYFKEKGSLMPIKKSQIKDFNDIMPFATKGLFKENKYWGIPQMACTEYLIYKKNDKELENANTISKIVSALGQCTYSSEIPPTAKGLMINLSDETTNAIYYAKTMEELTENFPVELPLDEKKLNKEALNNLKTLLSASSMKNAWYAGDNSYQRAKWFSKNCGRAYIGFSESLTQLPDNMVSEISMKIMPWSNNEKGIKDPLLYCDIIGISPKAAERGSDKAALKLANLMASKEVMINTFKAADDKGPQYITPVRISVMNELASVYPGYAAIKNAVENSGNPILLDLGKDVKKWMNAMRPNIKNIIGKDPKCQCANQ